MLPITTTHGQQARCGVSWISKIDPAGNVSTHVSGLNAPMGVTIDSLRETYMSWIPPATDRLPSSTYYRITPAD